MKKTERYLFLDDIREPSWVYTNPELYDTVRNYDEFVSYVETNGIPAFISLDHDINDSDKSGYDCIKWLGEFCLNNKIQMCEATSHSANPIGKIDIIKYIENFKYHFGIGSNGINEKINPPNV